MKRVISVLLLFAFLLNLVGYYGVYSALRLHARLTMNQQLDSGSYSEKETLTFKVPIAIPYHLNDKEFDRFEGTFEDKGEFLTIVKKKLENDTLYVVCLKNAKEKQLSGELNEFARASTDLPASSKQSLKIIGNFIKDYVPASGESTITQQVWSMPLLYSQEHFKLLVRELPVISPPPDFRV